MDYLNYRNGDVIETNPESYPLISHFGVLVWWENTWYVLHNTTDKGVFKEKLEDTLKNGELVAVRPSKISGIDSFSLMERFKKYEGMKYDLQNFNCESFVNLLTKESVLSWQSIVIGAIATTVVIITIIFIVKWVKDKF